MFTLKKYLPSALSLFLLIGIPAHAVSPQNTPLGTPSVAPTIKATLQQAGLNAPIASIAPTAIDGLYEVFIVGSDVPILTTATGNYLIQGVLKPNPSFQLGTTKLSYPKGEAGHPISQAHKTALLSKMSTLKHIDSTATFYYTNIDGLLWGVSGMGGMPFLVSADGRYFINGEIATIKEGQYHNTDADFERTKNRHVLNTFLDSELVIYPAKGTQKTTVYVATDIHCPYCQQFHAQIPALNTKGITVKVIGYPIDPKSVAVMHDIWCKVDPVERAALLSAAMAHRYPNNHCDNQRNPMTAAQIRAHSLGIFATPAIYSDSGELFDGDFSQPEFLTFLGL